MISQYHKDQAQHSLQHSLSLAEKYFKQPFNQPELLFNQRGTIAGTAHLAKNQVRINSQLLVDNIDEFVQQVIPHEVAHIVAYQRFGKVKPHGVEWRAIMTTIFGLKPTVRHSLDTRKTQGKMYSYRCGCGPVELTIRRHNNVINKQRRYQCRRCRQILEFETKTSD